MAILLKIRQDRLCSQPAERNGIYGNRTSVVVSDPYDNGVKWVSICIYASLHLDIFVWITLSIMGAWDHNMGP